MESLQLAMVVHLDRVGAFRQDAIARAARAALRAERRRSRLRTPRAHAGRQGHEPARAAAPLPQTAQPC